MIEIGQLSEFGLLIKYLERNGSEVIDASYYTEHFTGNNYVQRYVGVTRKGYINGQCFFFGNAQISIEMGGVIVATNRNGYSFQSWQQLKNNLEPGNFYMTMMAGEKLALLGDGTYHGNVRLYGMGLSSFQIAAIDVGAATVSWSVHLNGYIFVIR